MATELSIGGLAEAAGVNVETIRYYQRLGLLLTPPKPLGGQRRYPPDQVRRVRFIKRAQVLGFTLAEVGELLTLDAARGCEETRTLADRKRMLIEQKMADLEAMRVLLSDLVQQCDRSRGGSPCPIIDVLGRD